MRERWVVFFISLNFAKQAFARRPLTKLTESHLARRTGEKSF